MQTDTGLIARLAPDLVRVRAPNPSAFTAAGTNTYILGEKTPCVIDPGPESDSHLRTILGMLQERQPCAILVTHAHLDHSALAPALSACTGSPVLAFGDARAGLRPEMNDVRGSWGADLAFVPDRRLADGEIVRVEDSHLVARHTPGHMGNHLCFDDGQRLFTGDHAMGFATSIVSPPEGDMGDYMSSLQKLIELGSRTLLPGHGDPVSNGHERLAELLAHRTKRELQVLNTLNAGPRTAAEIAEVLYPDLAKNLSLAATRNVLAHLLHLARQSCVAPDGVATEITPFRRV